MGPLEKEGADSQYYCVLDMLCKGDGKPVDPTYVPTSGDNMGVEY